jgi:hypothetical protein
MLSYALSAASADASGPLGGQPITVPAVESAVQHAAAPVVRSARTTVAAVSKTAERTPVAPAVAPVAEAPAAVEHTVAAVTGTVAEAAPHSSPKPAAAQRHPVRHRRGGATVARAASAHTPAHTAKRSAQQRTAVAMPALPVNVVAAAEHSAASPAATPHRAQRTGSVAPVHAPEPVPPSSSSAVATAAGTSAGSAAAVLALLALLTAAMPRLGGLLRLPKGWAPMPPLLALPERPG